MKAEDVLVKSRYSLSDQDKSRWSDTRLLSLLNDCLLDIALTTSVYNYNGYVELIKNNAVYDLSPLASRINRVEYLNKPLIMSTFEEMDSFFGLGWHTTQSSNISHVVYNLSKPCEFRVYPLLDNASKSLVTHGKDHGIITNITYESFAFVIKDTYGDINPSDVSNYIRIYYVKKPKTINLISDELDIVIDSSHLSILADYVAGNAFKDNIDENSVRLGNEKLLFYANNKERLSEKNMSNFVHKIRTTKYRTF